MLLLLALGAAFFWRLWLMPDGFLYRPNSDVSDLTITHWPNAYFVRQSLTRWDQVPLWRPLILGGEPFAANPLSGLWYPPNVLLLILPLTFAFNLLFALHAVWAGWGGYALTRSMGASRAGGLLAAFTVMFAPKALTHLAAGHIGLYFAWAWVVWVFWAVRRLAVRGRTQDVATAAACGAMLLLADVRLGFYGGAAAGAHWLFLAWGERLIRPRVWLNGLAAGALAAALAAVQFVPLAMVAGRLNRGGLGLEESGIASLPPRYLVGLLVADHGGFQEWMTYVGAVGLLLALVGVARWKGMERWWWGGLALTACAYSLGTSTPVYGVLYRILPALGWLRGPARAWFLVVVAVGVLAAQGLTALEGTTSRRRRMDLVAAGMAVAALVGVAEGLALHLSANVVIATVVWSVAGALIALRAAGRVRASRFAGLVLALALADLWVVGFTLYCVRPADEVLSEGKAAAAWLGAQPGFFRVYSPSYSIPQHTGAAHGIEAVDGVDPFQLADYVTFMQAATRVNLPGYSVTVPSFPEVAEGEDMLLAHRDVVPDLRLLGLLNVRYLVAAYPMEAEGLLPRGEWDGVYMYENAWALPRAFVMERVGTVDGLEGALVWLAANDPAGAAVVEGGRALRGGQQVREARIIEWAPNRVRVEAEGPGLLVLSEVYDPDWRAWVDGEPADVVRADGILRAVHLGTGQREVTFVYRPAGLWMGGVATIVGCMALTLMSVGIARGSDDGCARNLEPDST